MILVTGGAGYVGSQVARMLLDLGHELIIFDNLSNGNKRAIDSRAKFIHGDLTRYSDIHEVFRQNKIDAVIHLASYCYVGESVLKPLDYYQNNIVSTLNLLQAMEKFDVDKLIFSSSCAVYGSPSVQLMNELTPTKPINPYGKSKLMNETIIQDVAKTTGLNYVILRFFNVSGSDFEHKIGEDHTPETHLIPNIIQSILDKDKTIEIYGDDYPTPDGTCIRDYIHVKDIASAHIKSLNYLLSNNPSNKIYNLGTGKGHSINEIINYCEKEASKKAKTKYRKRRPGDPDTLVGDYSKIHKELHWEPKYTIQDIIHSAWKWHSTFPKGYKTEE
ncbi:UDP-glucose 4-epimerase GalE [Terrilactibacillus laevilacticus]|uniref:UDP-glucose 4-epimerase n=1 Tax=Terrilactibacillus laevilacticus TaxID=1380157 RepID=A0ABW5PNE4_9BACI|nr:UDP-glucose 4-epimerase GalE [Terrilactibacillus laevilacticus]